MDGLDILKKLVSFNTINDKENKEIINFIEKYLLENDFYTIKKDKYLIMESKFGEGKASLGFIGHTDTVPNVGTWNYNPFDITIEDDNVYGLGVCDMKGGIAAFLYALSKIDKSKIKSKIRVYFTYDEEIGFSGIKDIVNYEKDFPDSFIIGEPTNNEILLGSKGLIEYEVEFKGIKVHSSTPEKGKSAIMDAVGFINELKLYYDKNIRMEVNKEFLIPYTTFNVGVINGGDEINSVAEKCIIKFDFRTIIDSSEKIVNFVNNLVEKYNAKKYILNNIPAFLNRSIFSDEIKTSSFITEASFVKGERMILGPGPVNPHERNEYISLSSFNECIKQYENIIENICNK